MCAQMLPDSYHDQNLCTMRSLALSTSKIRLQTRDNDLLFSKLKESHSVELTEVNVNASCDPTNVAFTNSSQLLAHLESRATSQSDSGTSMDI
jgi:hypothetical protein